MNLNYARHHWTKPGENPPLGLILCAEKGAKEARYALENLPNKILAAIWAHFCTGKASPTLNLPSLCLYPMHSKVDVCFDPTLFPRCCSLVVEGDAVHSRIAAGVE